MTLQAYQTTLSEAPPPHPISPPPIALFETKTTVIFIRQLADKNPRIYFLKIPN
jgi:hypothetical protein